VEVLQNHFDIWRARKGRPPEPFIAQGRVVYNEPPRPDRWRDSASAPRVQPSGKEDVPVKTVQVGTEAGQTTRISGDLNNR
jgi:hypothetical protein